MTRPDPNGPLRVELNGSLELELPPDAAFPLFTALGEREWVPGWDPELVYPESGELEENQVFVTGSGAERTEWFVARLDRAGREVSYIRTTPPSRVARVDVAVRPRGEGSVVTVTYLWTALSAEGRRIIREQAHGYDQMLREWQRLLEALPQVA